MDKINRWIEKLREKWWASGLLNLFCLGVFLFTMRPTFETNDDLTFVEFATGAMGIADAHLVYQNYLLGKVYLLLYTLCKTIPWYGLLQYIFLWLAFSILTYVILQRVNGVVGLTLSAVVLCFFSYEAYIQMQYTKTAGILSIAGIVLVFYAITKKKISRISLGLGIGMACIGSMYRAEQFLPCAVLLSGIGVYELVYAGRERSIKRILVLIMALILIFLMVMGLKAYDKSKYMKDPVWREYTEYNELRTELLDYEFPKYKYHEEEYQDLGITEAAYQLWNHWNFGDPELFTIQNMRKLLALNEKKTFDKEVISDFFDKVPNRIAKVYAFYALLIVLVFWLIQEKSGKKQVMIVCYELMLLTAMYIYLFWKGRYLQNRVDVCLSLAVIMCLIWLMQGQRDWLTQKSGILIIGITLIFMQNLWIDHSWKNTQKVVDQEKNILQELSADTEHLYVVKNKTLSYSNGYGPLDIIPEGMTSNFTFFGGWETNTVPWNYRLERYHAINLYKDSINNDQVRIIDDEIDETMNYIHTYYDKDAQAEQIDEYQGYPVYRIISEK